MKIPLWGIFMSLLILPFLPAGGESNEDRIKGFTCSLSAESRAFKRPLRS